MGQSKQSLGETADRHPTVARSLREYGRGVAGGLMFSLPLLYTMEVWWAGFAASPARLLANLSATFVLLLGYNRYAGLRRDASWREVVIDSFEELGIGIVIAALALWLLGRFTTETPPQIVVGLVIVEAVTVAIGVSVGTAQLGAGDGGEGSGKDEGEGGGLGADGSGRDSGRGGDGGAGLTFVGQVVIAFCGAVLFAANVAPTEEILMLGCEISSGRAVGLALFSLLLAGVILYFTGFRGARRFAPSGDRLSVLIGTVVTYAVALAASAAILFFFGRFDGQALIVCASQTVVLGVAATLGASAGRLLLQ